MKRYLSLALTSAALLAPRIAQAQQELCAPSAIHLCVESKFTLTGSNTLNVFLFNGASGEGVNWQSVVTQLAIGGLPTTGSWSMVAAYFNDWNGSALASNGATALPSKGGWGCSSVAQNGGNHRAWIDGSLNPVSHVPIPVREEQRG